MVRLAHRATTADEVIARWQRRLGLMEWLWRREPVSSFQVIDEDGVPGNELVGVVIERPRLHFTIVHTRELTEHDVIHELLHVAFPYWPHRLIERWTEILTCDPHAVRPASKPQLTGGNE